MTQTTTLMPEGRQRYYNNDGTPAAGGKLYTYAAGTNAPKATYADADGTVPNPNPVQLDAHGEAVVYWSGAYKVDLKQADGQQVTGYPVDNMKTDPAGIWGVAAAVLAQLAATLGAALVGFILAATGAVQRSVLDKLRDTANVLDFGASRNAADNTAAINKAIAHCVASGGGAVSFPYFGTFNVLGTIYLPPYIKLNLYSCKLVGNGSNTMFETAYLAGDGTIKTNVGTPAESQLVVNTEIFGGRIISAGIGFNLYNFIEGCAVIGTRFEACKKAVVADRSFYSCFQRLIARAAGAAVTDAFTFSNFVNVMGVVSCAAEGYDRGFVISGGADGQKFLLCSAESCRVGVTVIGETSTLEFDTFYCENNTAIGFDLNTAGKKKITWRNSWFLNLPIGINGGAGMTLDIDPSNTWNTTPVRYKVNDITTDFTRFIDAPKGIFSGNLPAADGVTLDQRGHYEQEVCLFSADTGGFLVKTIGRNDGAVPFEFGGKAGTAAANTVPFSVVTKKDNATLSILTSIVNSNLQLVAYSLTVADNIGTYVLRGFVFGTVVQQLDTAGRTVVATVSGNKLVLEIGNLSLPNPSFGCTGLVRHV